MTHPKFQDSHRMRTARDAAARFRASADRRARVESRRLEALSGAEGFSESGEWSQQPSKWVSVVLYSLALLGVCYALAVARPGADVDTQEALYVDEGQDGAPDWWKE